MYVQRPFTLPYIDRQTLIRPSLRYKALGSVDQGEDLDAAPPSSWDAVTIEDWITRHVRNITGRDMDRAVDLFEQGFDRYTASIPFASGVLIF